MKKYKFNSEMLKNAIGTGDVTVRFLARAAQVSNSTIYNMLEGKYMPQAAVLFAVADALGIPAETLVIAENEDGNAKSYEASMFGPEAAESIREILKEYDLLSESAQRFVQQQLRIRQK